MSLWQSFVAWFSSLGNAGIPAEPLAVAPKQPLPAPQTATVAITPPPVPVDPPTQPAPHPLETVQQMVVRVCTETGLNAEQTDSLYRTIHCESNFNPKCVHPNIDPVSKKVTTTDYGICQVNDYWHIGSGKDFPSSDYVLNNPEACVRWMAKMWKGTTLTNPGNRKMWVCYLRGMSANYSGPTTA